MINYEILSEGNKTGKYFEVEVKQEVETGLFSSKIVITKMKLILKKISDPNNLFGIIEKILKNRSEWCEGLKGEYKYYYLPNGSKAVILSDDF